MDQLTLINQCFEKKILLNKELLESSEFSESNNFEELLIKLDQFNECNLFSLLLTLNKDNLFFLEKKSQTTELLEFDKFRVYFEKNKETESYSSFLNDLKQKLDQNKKDSNENNNNLSDSALNIVNSYQNKPKKYEIRDFTKIFISRYKFIENILRNRQELSNTLSINKILNKKEKETVSLIGIISEINQTKAGNFITVLEDLTGQIKIIITKNKKELFDSAKDLVPDEVIGIKGVNQGDVIFAEKIIWPEIPLDREFKKAPEEEHVIFLSDLHVGSTEFLEKEFKKFLSWLNGETGNQEQKELSQKIKYLVITGDIVDGVGIYPNQDKELTIKDVYQQFSVAAELLKRVPAHIKIIICPGNHEPLHLAEPQPAFNLKYAQPLSELPNVTLVSNPASINIAQTKDFPGFDILLYHGYSFDYYVANVDSIRSNGGYQRADLIMKFLLRRRHLAPTFTSTPYFPSPEDYLLIKKIPDFFVTGHIHYAVAANYRNVTMICGSCWQAKTSFQEKVGHEPQPARVPIVNLKTREIKILKFI
ncbi:DNA-directed DNA polymerase II small subunit [Candidatus Woesearchaeota archaeon]|nr:DNA-directed DNA polymerase II small subunit [Candidatus Woesearchaeota archaeon]